MFTSPLTYQLIHGDYTHLAFNSLWLLAFGGADRGAGRNGAVRGIWCIVWGARCVHVPGVQLGRACLVIGASGAVAGLMGGTMRFLFSAIDMGGIWRLREAPRSVPLMPVRIALTDKRVLAATGILIAINLLTIVGVGTVGAEGSMIAWESHIGGYLAGLLLFGLFDPTPRAPKRPNLHIVPTIH